MKKLLNNYPDNIFRIAVVIIFLLLVKSSSAQILKSLGSGVGNEWGISAWCFDNKDIYAIHPSEITSPFTTYNLTKWNGVSWTNIDSFKVNYGYQFRPVDVKAMSFYNGELYIAGNFDSVFGVANSRYIIKWRGKKGWAGIENRNIPSKGAGFTSINAMTVYRNQLIVAGSIDTLPDMSISNIAAWNGSGWGYVGSKTSQGIEGDSVIHLPKYTAKSGTVSQMFVYQDSLFVFGQFKKSGGEPALNIAKWDGQYWNGIYFPKTFYYGILSAAIYNGEIYASGYDTGSSVAKIYKTQGTSGNWTLVSSGSFGNQMTSMAVIAGKLWTSGENSIESFDGKKWETENLDLGKYQITLDTFYGNLYAFGWYGFYSQPATTYVNAGIIYTNLAKISGYIYNDLNQNCIPDYTDAHLVNKLIIVEPGPYYANTDSSGYYEVKVPPSGKYEVKCQVKPTWKQVCPSAGQFYTINDTKAQFYPDNNFAIEQIPNSKDIKISIAGLSGGLYARKGHMEQYRLTYENLGSLDIASAQISLAHPPNTGKFSASPSPDNYTNPLARWKISNFKAGSVNHIDFELKTDSALKISDSIQFVAWYDSMSNAGDMNIKDNRDTLTQKIVAAFDPNNKQSFPYGDIANTTSGIRYNIHFQNTGTATATKVVVLDTLDLALPLTDVTINSASHPFNLRIENNVLIWTFDNINLPDSTHDLKNSTGYISFSTGIKQGVGTGTVIKNTAYIYFDYEEPVKTNKTSNKIIYQSTGVQQDYYINGRLKLYPNPSSQQIFIENPGDSDLVATICNSVGQTMKTIQLPASKTTAVEVSNFASGVYFIKTQNFKASPIIVNH